MADNPHGFNLVKHRYGAPLNMTTNPYYVAAGYGTALFVGDPVVKTGTANTAALYVGSDGWAAGELREVNRATAGGGASSVTGIMVGRRNKVNDLISRESPASTEDVIFVADDPGIVYSAQEDGTSAATDMGLNYDVVFTTAGDATTGISGAELDTSSKATTITLQFAVLGLAARPHGNAIGLNAELLCAINTSTEGVDVAGI